MLGDDTVLVVPSVAGIALKVGTSAEELILYRQRALSILCIAGMAGLPQACVSFSLHICLTIATALTVYLKSTSLACRMLNGSPFFPPPVLDKLSIPGVWRCRRGMV